MKKLFLSIFLLTTFLLTSCETENSGLGDENYDFKVYKSKKTRVNALLVTDPIVLNQIASNNEFAIKTYNELIENDKSLIFSPVSIIYAMAMVYGGSEGNILGEMEQLILLINGLQTIHTALFQHYILIRFLLKQNV